MQKDVIVRGLAIFKLHNIIMAQILYFFCSTKFLLCWRDVEKENRVSMFIEKEDIFVFMKVLKWLDMNFERVLMATFLSIITLVVFYDIIMRNVFNSGQGFPNELARYCLLYITFLGVSYGFRYNAHIRVDIFPSVWPKTKPIFEVIADIGMFVFAIIVLVAGSQKLTDMAKTVQLSTALGIPMIYIYSGLWAGWFLLVLRFIQKYFVKLVLKKDLPGNNDEESPLRKL